MNDLEYISTICAFIAGFLLLVQLFLMRHRIKKLARIRIIQAKAKIYNMSKPDAMPKLGVDAWGEDLEGNRNGR